MIYLDVDDLLELADQVLDCQPKVRDYGLLASAAARPETTVFGQDAYPDLATKAAALLHSICVNHALIDGNKRLAWAAAVTFLAINDTLDVPDVDEDASYDLVLAVAEGRMTEVTDIAMGLRRLGLAD